MQRGLLVTSAVGILIGLLYMSEARKMPWGTALAPGSGVYPFLVGMLMLVGSIGTGLEAVLRRDKVGEVEWPGGAARWRLLAIVGATLGYVALLDVLGHPLTGALVVLVVLQVMGARSWPLKIGFSLAAGWGTYYLFAVVLGIPLPAGFWIQ